MDPRKRAWIWAGLGLAAGVGVVLVATKPGGEGERRLPGNGDGNGPLPPATPVPPPPTPERAPRVGVRQGGRVLLLGDSIAQGLAVPLNRLSTDARATLAVSAKSGTTIAAWATMQPPRCDVALVSLGTNDMKLADPTVERSKLEALMVRLREAATRVVWIAPPPMPFPDRGVRQMIAAAAAANGVELFPSVDVQRGPDLIHPTASGYAALAGLVWRWLG